MNHRILAVSFAFVVSTACGPATFDDDLFSSTDDELLETLDAEARWAENDPLDEAEFPILDADGGLDTESNEEADYAGSDGTIPAEPNADVEEQGAPPPAFPTPRSDASNSAEVSAVSQGVAARAAPPLFETRFNDPNGNSQQRRALETALVRLIDLARPGATITGAFYKVTRPRVVDALIRAERRGARVSLALDGKATSRGSRLYRKLKSLGSVRFCSRGACIGRGINHNKFMTISATSDGAQFIVWQASANLEGGASHNNAVIVRGNQRLYETYTRYFNDLYHTRSARPSYNCTANIDGGIEVYFSPNSRVDYVVNALRNVHCHKNGVQGTVRMAMAYFSGKRGSRIVDELDRLGEKGCSVEVMISDGKVDRVSSAVLRKLKKAKLSLRGYNFRKNVNGIHSKYFLIDAAYGGAATRRQIVFTGSHNLTNGAAKSNDEAILRVVNDGVYRAFMSDYARIRGHTRSL